EVMSMLNALANKKAVILSLVFLILELLVVIQLVNSLSERKSYTYKTNATIDFIGLPDGVIFVSCYDESGILHKDVIVKNKTIQGKLDYVESFYGKEIQILLNNEKNEALWLSDYKLWVFAIIIPLIYFLIVIYKKKATINSNLSQSIQ
ncbi:MAG: hypothetical protein J1F28_10875, partial [Oscillospiraceae bacterium]|nr:hypothetical protein [Oscillospiraceae bacterium]